MHHTEKLLGKNIFPFIFFFSIFFYSSCDKGEDSDKSENSNTDCTSDIKIDQSRGAANQTLSFAHQYSETLSQDGKTRTITANNIPQHKVGLFGKSKGALNPNAITAQTSTYIITNEPKKAASFTPLLGNKGPEYQFGILKNGVELDPIAAEPFPNMRDPNANWEWNLEPLNVNLGLDKSNAHVQPNGKYHYHGEPKLFLENQSIASNKMNLIGYAADGFPIYYKYAYKNANDMNSEIITMSSSYRLKTGNRPGNGTSAPCGIYDGAYTADYEYVENLGTLDKANGREGVTPEYPSGTYYYMITENFPVIPRYFRGIPSQSFKMSRP